MTGYTTTIGNRLTADGTYTYSYDNDGNMVGRTRTSDNQVTTYTYDFRNRLTEVLIKTSGGVTVQDDKFTYDVQNRRIGKNTLSGGQSWTGYDGVNPYADFNSSGSLTYRYLYGNAIDFLLARADTSGTPMWYLTDMLGSVREDVNTSGTVLDSITYDSYGNILTETNSSNGDRFKFTGREWDSEIGQYYYRARNYGPTIGRFENEDPLAFRGGDANLYRYVGNIPVMFVDPTGQGRRYPVSPTDPECVRLSQRISNIASQIKKRVMDIKQDKLKLPFFKPGAPNRQSKAGHLFIIGDLLGVLAVRIAEYWWKCTDRKPLEPPPPVPVPVPGPRPVPVPVPADPIPVPLPPRIPIFPPEPALRPAPVPIPVFPILPIIIFPPWIKNMLLPPWLLDPSDNMA
jgi:RHS repeat-associated protein